MIRRPVICRRPLDVLRLCLLSVYALAGPARGEIESVETTATGLQARMKIAGAIYRLSARVERPQGNAVALLLDTAPGDDLAPLARARGMTVVSLDISALPASARAQALRELVPRLREGTKRLLAHGRGEIGAALSEAGLFDGLLLQDSDPPGATPPGAREPRVIESWGSDAYWRAAPRPLPAPETENRRRYFIAGVASPAPPENCAAPVNPRNGGPAARALFAALDDWTRGVKPPPSRAPAPADLVAASALQWPKIHGFPAPPGGARFAPRIDPDGNELAGLRLPDQALPIATFTGFNAAKEEKDKKAPDCAAGAAAPFASSKTEREKTGDPRLSLVERYGSRAYFVATMRVIADKLVRERLLLKEDADAYVAAAKTAPF